MTVADVSSLLPAMLPRLWAFALRISSDRCDAEDLVQRACLCALEQSHELQADTVSLGRMFSIIYFTWIGTLPTRMARCPSSAGWNDDSLASVAGPAAGAPEDEVINQQIVDAVQALPEAQRVVMLLVAVEGLSYKEAGETLGVSIGTIMSRLSHARQAIGALITERSDRKMKTKNRETGIRHHNRFVESHEGV